MNKKYVSIDHIRKIRDDLILIPGIESIISELNQIIDIADNPKDKVESIIEAVCDHQKLTRPQLESKTRKREIVEARQMAMTLLTKKTSLTYQSIGELFGNRDHTTVIHAKKTVSDLCETDDEFKETFDFLEKKIQ